MNDKSPDNATAVSFKIPGGIPSILTAFLLFKALSWFSTYDCETCLNSKGVPFEFFSFNSAFKAKLFEV